MTEKRLKIAVLGGGIFGVTAALKLAESHTVTLYERGASLLQGATFANHNRQHFGFHYPRSPETALQCLESHSDFQDLYGAAEVWGFPNYYCIGAENSKVSVEQYENFCHKVGLEFREEYPDETVLDRRKVVKSFRVKEGVLDLYHLRKLVQAQISASTFLQVYLSSQVKSGHILTNGLKRLEILSEGTIKNEDFDCVVNATYAHYNTFCDWFGFQKRAFQFNLQELDIIELPASMRLGVTIMDGVYPSFLPFGNTEYHILAHVEVSQLIRESSFSNTPLLSRLSAIESNWAGVLKVSAEFLPILKQARYIKSFFVDRVVDAGNATSDARLTELTDHGSGCYSIFAAKVITCVSTAKKLKSLIRNSQ